MLMLTPPPHPLDEEAREGKNIMIGTVVKVKVGDLEDETREGFLGMLRKEMIGVLQEVVGKRSY